MSNHKWGPSAVGHGMQQCVYCKITAFEDAALGGTTCIKVPQEDATANRLKAEFEKLLVEINLPLTGEDKLLCQRFYMSGSLATLAQCFGPGIDTLAVTGELMLEHKRFFANIGTRAEL